MKLRIIIFQNINQNFGIYIKNEGKKYFRPKKKSLRGKNYILRLAKIITFAGIVENLANPHQ